MRIWKRNRLYWVHVPHEEGRNWMISGMTITKENENVELSLSFRIKQEKKKSIKAKPYYDISPGEARSGSSNLCTKRENALEVSTPCPYRLYFVAGKPKKHK